MARSPQISYTLGMSRPSTHLFQVEMHFEGLDSSRSPLDIALPNWRSGRYLILDFASGIVEFDVVGSSDKRLPWRKIDKSTWRIETEGERDIRIRYQVYANEFSLRTRGLNDERAFVDGAAVFMYAEEFRWQPVTLTVVPHANWHVTTGLDSLPGVANRFQAPHYDHLVDCPLEIGTQKDFTFRVRGKEHVLSISGEGNYEADKLIRDITKIIEGQARFWGGGLPYERYVFLVALAPGAGGGTEHINSCVLGSSPFVFVNPDSYRGFLGLVSHEFFHTWNVKQLRPAAIDRYDWSRESYMEELWIAEGTTSYCHGLLLVRSGFVAESAYLDGISSAIEMDRARPGNLKQSLSECSFDAWIKQWKVTKQAANFETDYYSRGAVVSLALDLTIRQRTKNLRSLGDVMREMFRRFPLGKGGYTKADFKKVCEDISGSSLQQFFSDHVDGVRPLPWQELVAVAGLELRENRAEKKPWLGLMTRDVGEKTMVVRVLAGSPAYDAGIDVDDEIVALDGYRIRSANLAARVGEMKEGAKVKLTVFRDDILRECDVTLRPSDVTPMKIHKVEKPSAFQKKVFASWLGAPTEK